MKTFTPADKFSLPDLNGTINFAVSGSYSKATLSNNTWIFTDLALNNQSIPGFGLYDFRSVGNLTFSARDSNVTIFAYLTINNSFPLTILSYTVEGTGKQIVNFNLNPSNPPESAEWSVIIPTNVVLAEGQGWTLLPDNSLVINYAASNVTVVHFDLNLPIKSNLPFYIQHSVALVTVAALVIVASLAVIVRVITKRRKES